ncbi:hypothetical protein V9T40_008522 [Parthenolecanium corni]|uniref:PEST proteolytic signal-containing nuclear protein n=1 Tax=Parthenolecanium corni TaxID=536013 RepID=A0AAN9TQL1_9HEMI
MVSFTESNYSRNASQLHFLTFASVSPYPGTSDSDDRESTNSSGDTKKPKISFSTGLRKEPNSALSKKGIQIKLGSQKDKTPSTAPLKPPSRTVASVFGDESDEEPEEMPPEARMRMRNIGRDTPTSSGPNSYGKTKQGFCNVKKVFEKNLKEATFDSTDDKPKTKKY